MINNVVLPEPTLNQDHFVIPGVGSFWTHECIVCKETKTIQWNVFNGVANEVCEDCRKKLEKPKK